MLVVVSFAAGQLAEARNTPPPYVAPALNASHGRPSVGATVSTTIATGVVCAVPPILPVTSTKYVPVEVPAGTDTVSCEVGSS